MPAEQAASPARAWSLANGRRLSLDAARVVAVLNLTPDSFSDGGRLATPEDAVRAAERAQAEGADMLDLGGESTRPGAAPVPAKEQADRILPALLAIRRAGVALPISVDTTSAEVARAALDAGADAVNDQSAGRDDPAMLPLVAERGAGIVLMHRPRRPGEDAYSDRHPAAPDYGAAGVVEAVRAFLAERMDAAGARGVAPERQVIDPGLGFGKSVEQNLAVLGGVGRIASLGAPVLLGASRKSFVGRITNEPDPARRVCGSVAAAVVGLMRGASLLRVHDVAAHVQAVRMAESILAQDGGAGATRTGRSGG